MLIEKIKEPIRVLAGFSGGGIKPIRFDWQGRSYCIEKISGQWLDRRPDG